MRDVIQQVIAVEAEAKCLVEAGRLERDRILSEAQQRGEELVSRTRREARADAGKMIETAVHEAEREKQECLARVAAEIEAQIRLDETTRQRAMEAIVRCVCGFD